MSKTILWYQQRFLFMRIVLVYHVAKWNTLSVSINGVHAKCVRFVITIHSVKKFLYFKFFLFFHTVNIFLQFCFQIFHENKQHKKFNAYHMMVFATIRICVGVQYV